MLKIVKTKAGYHLQIKSRNGKILVWSEVYKRKQSVEKLIKSLKIIFKNDYLMGVVKEAMQKK